MELWERAKELFGVRRGGEKRSFAMDARLHAELLDLAAAEGRPVEEVQEELLVDGLRRRSAHEDLLRRWESLSPREKDVSALTCLGYTNRQMAAMLQVSQGTVKGYLQQALVKFQFSSKREMQLSLARWDFRKWGPEAQD
jgi:DNA-binding CsgD family transcriptional regulator